MSETEEHIISNGEWNGVDTEEVGSEGIPEHHDASSETDDKGKGKEKEKPNAAKKKFQKKTKQVFLVPDHIRQLRREERYPWVMEDGAGNEVWTAAMEEVSKAETQAMFMPAANDIFKFVPAHRWYKFQKKPSHRVPSLDEAEDLVRIIHRSLWCFTHPLQDEAAR